MNFKQLTDNLSLFRSRGPVNIEFAKGAADYLEAYPEGGMRATILEMYPGAGFESDVIRMRVSYEAFDEYNKAFESCNYFDKNGDPVLNARDAGFYKPIETLYVMENDDITKYFTLIDNSSTALYNKYVASGSAVSYVRWLEDKVIRQQRDTKEWDGMPG